MEEGIGNMGSLFFSFFLITYGSLIISKDMGAFTIDRSR